MQRIRVTDIYYNFIQYFNNSTEVSFNLSIHEYMSFALLEKAGIPIPRYRVCETPEEVEKSAADLGLFLIIDMNY
jgi:phosphoribosylaminoimidazole carboxylase (NCAIR synthetase)